MTAAVSGWLVAVTVGTVLGLLVGSVPLLDRSTSILIDFGRSFPVLALMPVVIMLLGATAQMETIVVAFPASGRYWCRQSTAPGEWTHR